MVSGGGIGSLFGKKKTTYGIVLPEEIKQAELDRIKRRRKMHRNLSKDCFVPSDLNRWELPQYETLFNHLISHDGTFRRRLSSASSSSDKSTAGEEEGSSGPLKAVQKWFKDIIRSLTHHSGDYDLGGDVAVEGIPVDVCEKLRYVHIYF